MGDIESLPFLEAVRQLRNEVGRENCAFVHVSLMPFIGPSGELKTKPTQHSVKELRSLGLQPDAIVCRSDRPITRNLKEKISLLCDVPMNGVISAVDADSIYQVPLVLHAEGLDTYVARHLGIDGEPDLTDWRSLSDRISVPIAFEWRPFTTLAPRAHWWARQLLAGIQAQVGLSVEHLRTSDDSQTTAGLHLAAGIELPVFGGPTDGGLTVKLWARLLVTRDVALDVTQTQTVFEPGVSGQIFGGICYYP